MMGLPPMEGQPSQVGVACVQEDGCGWHLCWLSLRVLCTLHDVGYKAVTTVP
jgi:hypothetical protein